MGLLKNLSTGPELPYGISASALTTSPDGNGIMLVGGYSSSLGSDSILELKANGQEWVGSWTTLTTKLQFARYYHIVIPILMDKDSCDLSGVVPGK